MEDLGQINWKEAVIKGRSKREIYSILVTKGKYYLPHESQTNSDFIHDIMVGNEKVSCTEISLIGIEADRRFHVICSSNKGTSSIEILEEARKHTEITAICLRWRMTSFKIVNLWLTSVKRNQFWYFIVNTLTLTSCKWWLTQLIRRMKKGT